MATHSIRGFNNKAGEILRDPDAGQEVIVTGRREPPSKLASVHQPAREERLLNSLEGSLPDRRNEDVLDLKALWAPRARRNSRRKKTAAG